MELNVKFALYFYYAYDIQMICKHFIYWRQCTVTEWHPKLPGTKLTNASVFSENTKWLMSNQHAETWVFLGGRNHLTIIIPHSGIGCKVINNQRGAQCQVFNTQVFHLTWNHHLVITTWYLTSGIIVLLNCHFFDTFLDKSFALRWNSWMPDIALDMACNFLII